jgi:hypothetical protein
VTGAAGGALPEIRKGERKMRKMGQEGIAVTAIVTIVVALAGGAVATPVIVDAVDVDPDHPLYSLERIGERIRMIGDEDQSMERWGEYQRMVAKGKGLEYQAVLEEFRDKLAHVVETLPENVDAKREFIEWMQGQQAEINRVRVRMLKQTCEEIKAELENNPELQKLVQETLEELENYEVGPMNAERLDNLNARLSLIRERVRNWGEDNRIRESVRNAVERCLHGDNLIVDINISVNIGISMSQAVEAVQQRIGEMLEEFENELGVLQERIDNLPENSRLSNAVETLMDRAVILENRAQEVAEEKPRRALGLLQAATQLLRNAGRIIDQVQETVGENIDNFAGYGERITNEIQQMEQRIGELPEGEVRERLMEASKICKEAIEQGDYEIGGRYCNEVRERLRERLEEHEEEFEELFVEATGVIEKSGATVWMYGSHVLVGENGDPIYALTGWYKQLNQHSGELVQIQGVLIHQGLDFGPPLLLVKTITPVEE